MMYHKRIEFTRVSPRGDVSHYSGLIPCEGPDPSDPESLRLAEPPVVMRSPDASPEAISVRDAACAEMVYSPHALFSLDESGESHKNVKMTLERGRVYRRMKTWLLEDGTVLTHQQIADACNSTYETVRKAVIERKDHRVPKTAPRP